MALVPILGDADSCWKEYENKYNSTDLDRLLIEEQAKVCYNAPVVMAQVRLELTKILEGRRITDGP